MAGRDDGDRLSEYIVKFKEIPPRKEFFLGMAMKILKYRQLKTDNKIK